MANYNLTQTGAEVQAILNRVAAGYIYMGTADLTTTPDTTSPNVCYILTAVGTYTNFGNIQHASGIGIALWNGTAWSYQNVPSSAVVQTDATPTENSTNPVQSGGVYKELNIIGTQTITPDSVDGLTLRTGVINSSTTDKCFYIQGSQGDIVHLYLSSYPSAGTWRVAYGNAIPAAGGTTTGYKTYNSSTYRYLDITFPYDGYAYIATTNTYTCYYEIENEGTIGAAVYVLQQSVSALENDVAENADAIENIAILNADFPNLDKCIANGNDSRYPAGTVINVTYSACTDYISLSGIAKMKFALEISSTTNAYAVCYFDAEMNAISGLQGYSVSTPVTINAEDFPEGAEYVRLSTTSTGSPSGSGYYAKLYSASTLISLHQEIENIGKETDTPLPLDTYWAVCGDSITHANHNSSAQLPVNDPYRPIDDYVGKGYANANSGAYPNYAYHFCKQMRMQWANYGYGGTILGNYIPKYVGTNNYLYPFVDTRITQFKEGIEWNYISILFGWNDVVYGPIYQRDKWLSDTYGGDIGYPVNENQTGTSGFATQAQKDACDALGDTYYFNAFVGTINDTGTDTYMGAYNYAITYLMQHYPKAKIMVIAPFINGSENSQKMRNAVHAIAEKFGLVCFDFEDVLWWYFRTEPNTTSFPNPDRQDGRWVKENGETTPATIEGYNRARFCKDSVHPTLLGYQWLADPIGYTLLNK